MRRVSSFDLLFLISLSSTLLSFVQTREIFQRNKSQYDPGLNPDFNPDHNCCSLARTIWQSTVKFLPALANWPVECRQICARNKQDLLGRETGFADLRIKNFATGVKVCDWPFLAGQHPGQRGIWQEWNQPLFTWTVVVGRCSVPMKGIYLRQVRQSEM